MDRHLPIALLVAAGGAAGAVARWAVVGGAPADGRFPWPTLAVNLVGCLVVGLLVRADRTLVMLAGIGFAGGLTTFATFSLELAVLLDRGEPLLAAAYLTSSLVGGVGAVLLGRWWSPW